MRGIQLFSAASLQSENRGRRQRTRLAPSDVLLASPAPAARARAWMTRSSISRCPIDVGRARRRRRRRSPSSTRRSAPRSRACARPTSSPTRSRRGIPSSPSACASTATRRAGTASCSPQFLAYLGGEMRPMGRDHRHVLQALRDAPSGIETIVLDEPDVRDDRRRRRTASRSAARTHPAVRQMLTILTRDESFHVPLNVHFLRRSCERSTAVDALAPAADPSPALRGAPGLGGGEPAAGGAASTTSPSGARARLRRAPRPAVLPCRRLRSHAIAPPSRDRWPATRRSARPRRRAFRRGRGEGRGSLAGRRRSALARTHALAARRSRIASHRKRAT